jgi:hypothetical protein
MAAARTRPKQVFAAMFQLRVNPVFKLRQLLAKGELGRLMRLTGSTPTGSGGRLLRQQRLACDVEGRGRRC